MVEGEYPQTWKPKALRSFPDFKGLGFFISCKEWSVKKQGDVYSYSEPKAHIETVLNTDPTDTNEWEPLTAPGPKAEILVVRICDSGNETVLYRWNHSQKLWQRT